MTASAAERLMAVVVLPTPPFWLAMEMMRAMLSSGLCFTGNRRSCFTGNKQKSEAPLPGPPSAEQNKEKPGKWEDVNRP